MGELEMGVGGGTGEKMERIGLPKDPQLCPLTWQAGSKWLLCLVTNEMVQSSAGLETTSLL